MKIVKKSLIVVLLFVLIANLSGCTIIEKNRQKIEAERQQRIDAVQSEVDYDYAVFDNGYIYTVINKEKKRYNLSALAKDILGENAAVTIPYSTYSTGEKAYFCVRYNTYWNSEHSSATLDVALFSFEYTTAKCELVYDYKDVAPTMNDVHTNGRTPKVFRLADENYGIVYENGEIKVLNLQTKEITYTHRVYDDPQRYADLSEGSPYGNGKEYVDYILDGAYYEYKDGTFISHTFAFESMQNGDVAPFYESYYNAQKNCIYRIGDYVCSDHEEKAFNLTTGEEVSYAEITKGLSEQGQYELSENGNVRIPFYQSGEKYYLNRELDTIYNSEKELLIKFDSDYFINNENTACQQIKVFYDGETEQAPEEVCIKLSGGKCFVFCAYEYPLFMASDDFREFIFEYDVETGSLKYVGYFPIYLENRWGYIVVL